MKWLKTARIDRYDDIQVEYKVENKTRATSGYDIQEGSGIVSVNIAEIATERIKDDLPAEIFNTCMHLRPSKHILGLRELAVAKISRLLFSDNLDNWAVIVRGYQFAGDNPLLPSMVEILETTNGYQDTRQRLKEWYGACQICRRRTPYDESGDESLETVTSIVSMRGGRYSGTFEKYLPGNCLFLCPNHQALFKRGLVKVPYLELINDDNLKKAKEEISKKKQELVGEKNKKGDMDRVSTIGCEVFETTYSEDFQQRDESWSWHKDELSFRRTHLLQFLEWISDYKVKK